MDLSPKQQKILDCIRESIQEKGRPPTIREIGDVVKISSTSVVNYNLNILQEKGFIQRDRDVSRGVQLVELASLAPAEPAASEIIRVPLIGRIVAGEPVPIPETLAALSVEDTIALTRDIVEENGPMYALEVKGDSMIDALIHDGDIVIMKRQSDVNNGDLVAAWLKNEKETTLKRFYRESSDLVRLQPANPTIQPIYVHASNLDIQGKVIAIVRQL